MLELLARHEPHETARCAAAERLGRLAEQSLQDVPRAIAAWRSLLGSPLHEDALVALERLYTATEAFAELIEVLEKRAELSSHPASARVFALRAAELRTAHTKDCPRAISAWTDFLALYGPSREVHAKVIPLLEQEKKWDQLAAISSEELALAPEGRRSPCCSSWPTYVSRSWTTSRGRSTRTARFGSFTSRNLPPARRSRKCSRPPRCGSRRPTCSSPRTAKKEPRRGSCVPLEASAESLPPGGGQLEALDEATHIAERELRDPKRALELAGRALAIEVQTDIERIGPRLELVLHLAALTGDAFSTRRIARRSAGRSAHRSSARVRARQANR